jgi:hypothetical protein
LEKYSMTARMIRFGSNVGALHKISVTVGSPCGESRASSKTSVESPLRQAA